jgi:hypothetical protein
MVFATTATIPAVLAQPTEELDPVANQARQLFLRGQQRYRAGDLREARDLFLAAFALDKRWSIALNLGQCELEMGLVRDAAEHLDFGLSQLPADQHEVDRGRAQVFLKKARARVGAVRVSVNVEGAEVFVDRELVGKSPLRRTVYVEPGARTFEARIPQRQTATVRLDAKAGTLADVALAIPDAPVAAAAAPAVDAGDSTPAQSHPGRSGEGSKDSGPPVSMRTVVTVSGAALTLVAVGTALVYHGKASNAADDAAALDARATAQLGGGGCTGPGAAASSTCSELESKLDDKDSANGVETIAWIGASALAAGTIAAYLFWPDADEHKVGFKPLGSPHAAALVLEGRF